MARQKHNEVDQAAFTDELMNLLGNPEVHFGNYPTMSPLPSEAPPDALDPLSSELNAAIRELGGRKQKQ